MATSLKGLTFTAFVPPKTNTNADPALKRRAKMISRLEDQKRLLANPEYSRNVKKWKKNDHGQKQLVERTQRVSPCWFEMEDGKYAFLVKSGWSPIEFANGKTAIQVPDLKRLPGIIDQVISAVKEGELDQALEAASAQVRRTLKKK